MRRLTASEYDQTVSDLLGISVESANSLPEDQFSPFDNDASAQVVSQALIEGAELVASDLAEAVLADPETRDRITGCAPAGPLDRACMQSFLERFGRSALRRPLTPEEVSLLLDGEGETEGAMDIAAAASDFYAGVGVVLRTLLQDPEFLYRVEIGEDIGGGIRKLDDFEVASRLSYLVWGSMPDDALLDRAAEGLLDDAAVLERELDRMLDDPRARARMARFHAMWLGYEQLILPGTELSDAMLAESSALVERVLFTDERPWRDVFTANETFLSPALAQHYGMPAPDADAPGWVRYDTPLRRGILSHGTFLALGSAFGDTSPVQRGVLIRERLFCEHVQPPPPTVDVDQRPEAEAGICKPDRYAAHASGGCAGCHALFDPVGFGLEQFDLSGRFRTFEPDNPNTDDDESTCVVTGEGHLAGVGAFSGPGELAELALESGRLTDCLVLQYYRFAVGRSELGPEDLENVSILNDSLDQDFAMRALLRRIVTDPSFRHRREPGVAADGEST